MTAAEVPEELTWTPETGGILPVTVYSKEFGNKFLVNSVLRCMTKDLVKLAPGIDVTLDGNEKIRDFAFPYCFIGDCLARLDVGMFAYSMFYWHKLSIINFF